MTARCPPLPSLSPPHPITLWPPHPKSLILMWALRALTLSHPPSSHHPRSPSQHLWNPLPSSMSQDNQQYPLLLSLPPGLHPQPTPLRAWRVCLTSLPLLSLISCPQPHPHPSLPSLRSSEQSQRRLPPCKPPCTHPFPRIERTPSPPLLNPHPSLSFLPRNSVGGPCSRRRRRRMSPLRPLMQVGGVLGKSRLLLL